MTQTDEKLSDPTQFGMRLRAAREARKLSLEDISNRLRLHPDIIHALETGHTQHVRPTLFMRGYLKSYGRLLDFSDQDINHALTEPGLTLDTNTPLMPRLESPFNHSVVAPWLQWTSATIFITLAFLVFVWWNAYPVTLIREKLSASSLSMPIMSTEDHALDNVQSNDISTEMSTPTVPEPPLMLPSHLGILPDTIATPQESGDNDPS